MDVPVATLVSFSPVWGDPAEWDRAFEQVDNYLRAHRLGGRWRRAQLAAGILARVAAQPPPDPPCSPVTLAIDATDKALAEWFRELLPGSTPPDERGALSTGRLALLLCDGCSRWPESFLSHQAPDELKKAMLTAVLKAGPELHKGKMVPRPRDWGLVADWFGGTLGSLDRRPYLKALLAWFIVSALMAYLFSISR